MVRTLEENNMNSLLDSSSNLVMKESGEVFKWETLNGDVLGIIFGKLTMMDVTMGASRVCASWFLSAQNTTLWNTVDLVASHEKSSLFYYPRVNPLEHDVESYVTRPGVYFKRYACPPANRQNSLGYLLIEITKLCCTAPRNLFFNFYSYIQDKELVFAAERMPNVEKLVLPMWCSLSENSFRIAFSQWKNLQTLVIMKNPLNSGRLEFQAVGENCPNLTNLKFVGLLDDDLADQIVLHLQVLKRLSLRCSFMYPQGLSHLVNGLQNLEILNLSHSSAVHLFPVFYLCKFTSEYHPEIILGATQKLHRFIMCPQSGCPICIERWSMISIQASTKLKMCRHLDKYWQDDEIEEFKF